MKKTIAEILNEFTIEDIELALVQLFVTSNGILVENNLLIKSILNKKSKKIIAIKDRLANRFKYSSMHDIVRVFELLIPKSDKRVNGAFFTPQVITDFIVGQIIKNDDQTVCDPSCGCGAFLVSVAECMLKRFQKRIVDIIEENLYGVDIAEYSVRRAKILLSLLAIQNGEDEEEFRFNIVVADSLTMDWQKNFAEIMSSGGFDVVIGNPPYVKFQDLDIELRSKLYENWYTLKTGNYNLYFAFFEVGVNIMKTSGVLGYITPNNYFTSLAGIHLREYLTTNKLVERIVDFNHHKIFEAQTYTCITFLNKRGKDSFGYERIEEREYINSLDKIKYSKIFFKELNNKKWRLLREADRCNIKKIETAGARLGDIADIRVGIATCKDSVYFVNGATLNDGLCCKQYKGENYLIEVGITRPIAKISDFKNQENLRKNNRRIIFPYKRVNGKPEIIGEIELQQAYPRCYEYLLAAKDELTARDKGNVEYPEWYAYARTQGLNFFGKKLLTPTFSAEPRFLYEDDEDALFCNGYAIYLTNEADLFSDRSQQLELDTLAKILNSKVMGYYIKQTSVAIEGGYPCYQKNFIESFKIPEFDRSELKLLKSETNRNAIDSFLIKKYGITIEN